MAIYHLHVKVIGRKAGSSAVASAAYRSASRLRDERIELSRFVSGWMQPDTQAALRAMLARIGK